MSLPKNKKSSHPDTPGQKQPLKLSTTFDNLAQFTRLSPRTPCKRRRGSPGASPVPSSDHIKSLHPSISEQEQESAETDHLLSAISLQTNRDPFSPRAIKPFRRSRPRTTKFTSSTPPKENGARAEPPPTPAINTPDTCTPTPITSEGWCQAQQRDPAAVSLAVATRDMTGVSMGFGSGSECEDRQEEEERLRKKAKRKNEGFDEGQIARWFESIASPGGFEPLPEVRFGEDEYSREEDGDTHEEDEPE